MCVVEWLDDGTKSPVWNDLIYAHATAAFCSIANWGVKCVVLGMLCWEKEVITEVM